MAVSSKRRARDKTGTAAAQGPDGTDTLNLTVLQRQDPHVSQVLATARHVTVYEWSDASQDWSRCDIEGSLFLVTRRSEPKHQMVLMNRLNTDNLVEPLVPGVRVQYTDPYLLFRTASGRVLGLWFYAADERKVVRTMIERLCKPPPSSYAAAAGARSAAPASVPASTAIGSSSSSNSNASLPGSVTPTNTPVRNASGLASAAAPPMRMSHGDALILALSQGNAKVEPALPSTPARAPSSDASAEFLRMLMSGGGDATDAAPSTPVPASVPASVPAPVPASVPASTSSSTPGASMLIPPRRASERVVPRPVLPPDAGDIDAFLHRSSSTSNLTSLGAAPAGLPPDPAILSSSAPSTSAVGSNPLMAPSMLSGVVAPSTPTGVSADARRLSMPFSSPLRAPPPGPASSASSSSAPMLATPVRALASSSSSSKLVPPPSLSSSNGNGNGNASNPVRGHDASSSSSSNGHGAPLPRQMPQGAELLAPTRFLRWIPPQLPGASTLTRDQIAVFLYSLVQDPVFVDEVYQAYMSHLRD